MNMGQGGGILLLRYSMICVSGLAYLPLFISNSAFGFLVLSSPPFSDDDDDGTARLFFLVQDLSNVVDRLTAAAFVNE